MSSRHCINRIIHCTFSHKLALILLISAILLSTGCSQDSGDDEPIIDPVNGTITLYSATTEKHLAQTTDEEGNLITLLGTRDALGTPSELESVFVQAPGEIGSSEGTFCILTSRAGRRASWAPTAPLSNWIGKAVPPWWSAPFRQMAAFR